MDGFSGAVGRNYFGNPFTQTFERYGKKAINLRNNEFMVKRKQPKHLSRQVFGGFIS